MDKQILGQGFSATTAYVKQTVQSGEAAGVAAYVAQSGKVLHRQYEGHADRDAARPIADDTIYRIYSMSKVITSVALLQLYERGLFTMYDPVSDFLAGFSGQQVFIQPEPGKVDVVPARRPVVMRDLFTMTSGIPYPGAESPAAQEMNKLMDQLEAKLGAKELMNKVGGVPLAFHPGEQWLYGLSIDVLGGALEAITGTTLGAYLKENIFDPLGMVDTGFSLTPAQLPRLSALYLEEEGRLSPAKAGEGILADDPLADPPFHSGGGGLFSTLDDYARFAQMLLEGGTLGGERILGRKTVDLMRRNHLTPEQRMYDNWDTQRGYGYGLGVRVRLENELAGSNGSVGEWGWDGMAGTWFCVDPAEDLIALFLVQRVPGNHGKLVPPFLATVYGAL